MTTLNIRKIDDKTMHLLRERAAHHGRSLEEEIREVLSSAVKPLSIVGKPIGDLLVELSRPGVELPDVRDLTPDDPVAL